MVTLGELFGELVAILHTLALLGALESLGVDLSVEVFIQGRHSAFTAPEVGAKVVALGHAVAHQHLQDFLVFLDVGFELTQGDRVVMIGVSLSE